VKVYLLLDPVDHTVRYAGVSVDVQRRLQAHMKGETGRPEMREWIRNINALGMQPEVRVVSWCSPRNWARQERRWITWLRKQCCIYNIGAGGEDRKVSAKERDWERRRQRKGASQARHRQQAAAKPPAPLPKKPPRLFEEENETYGR
jgi:hypothetical protein